MKMTVTSTGKIVEFNGLPARVWEGVTERGVPVLAFVTRVAVPESVGPQELAVFELELAEQTPPSPAVEAWPARMVLD